MATKFCGKCKTDRPVSEFQRRGPNGLQPWCRTCKSANDKQWYQTNKDDIKFVRRNRVRKWKYGLTEEGYQDKLKTQDGKCACCGSPNPDQVDHDHKCCPGSKTCGKCIRGILCVGCNTFIGKIETNPELYDKAQAYLQLQKN